MRRFSLVGAFIVCIACLVLAQAPPQMPKPGPEHKRLGYFTGTWRLEGETKPGPFGPGGKFTGTDHNDWMEGGRSEEHTSELQSRGHLVCRLLLEKKKKLEN